MKTSTLLITGLTWVLLTSCAFTSADKETFYPQDTPLETLKESYRSIMEEAKRYQISEQYYMLAQNEEEVMSSLKINDEVDIENTEMRVVFYSYNIGSDIIRDARFFIQRDGKWLLVNKYFSSYDDDPFGNGNGIEAKALLKKVEKWKEDNDLVPWY